MATKAELQNELNELRIRVSGLQERVSAQPIGVITQLRESFKPANRLAAFTGLCLGGIVPLATYWLAHHEVNGGGLQDVFQQFTFYLVVGGLIYSAKTVWVWGRQAFGCVWKATGFVLLLEGVLTLSGTPWLSVAALVYLMGINAVATASTLAKRG